MGDGCGRSLQSSLEALEEGGIIMRNFGTRKTARDWARMALDFGLFLTEPKVRAAAANQVRERVDNLKDNVSRRYDDAVERLEAAGVALRGDSHWTWRMISFLAGVGVGAGVGLLLAPASGKETREAILDKAVDVKNKVAESAAAATSGVRRSVTSMPSTGTQGD
jgi:hypothetical protein